MPRPGKLPPHRYGVPSMSAARARISARLDADGSPGVAGAGSGAGGGWGGATTTGAGPGEVTTHESLSDIGKRLNRAAILASILDPDNVKGLSDADRMKKRQAMEQAGVYEKATLKEVELIVDFIVDQKADQLHYFHLL